MVDKTLYTESSIESLSPRDFTRLKPGVYAGDTTYATQLLVEIVSNAVDEFRLGHGNQIDVCIEHFDGKEMITVKDNGQGFIYDMREDGTSILEAAFSVLNTSGKYREDGTYEGTSLGSFGIGCKLTNYLSHFLRVHSVRDGVCETIVFREGIFESRELNKKDYKNELNGTVVRWNASEEFFTNPTVELTKVRNLFKTLSCLCPGLTFNLQVDGGNVEEYYSNKGLSDLVDEAVKNKELMNNRCSINFVEGKYKMDYILTYTSDYSSTIVPYVNAGLTESGPHITQIKTALTREFNRYFREKGWLKEKDENLTGDDIQEGMYIVFNITAPNVSYDAQVKSRITKLDTAPFIQALKDGLNDWFLYNEKEIKVIAEKAINARKAREAAKKAREAVRNTSVKKEKKALKFDSKLADCYSNIRKNCEIYITEGDSASGNLKHARNNEFQAVLPIRGKILNVRKATLDKIQKNAEIMTMIEAFGLTINPKTMKLEYDPRDLRYGKIIIESDADVDGAHIKNLFYTFIWTFCPQLIKDGYVYAGVPPLYRITEGKDTYIYLKDDAALEAYKEAHKNSKYQVNRLKGLGEMSAEETEILVDPNQRIIKQITVDDAEVADSLFDDLMGTAVTPRKEFIVAHSQEAQYEV